MNINDIRATLETMSHEELVKFTLQLGIDRGFGIMTRGMAQAFYSTIESGKKAVLLDLCNVHAHNHLRGIPVVDQFINTTLSHFRHIDTWIKMGGDEILVLIDDRDVDVAEFVNRLDSVMAENNLYAVYGIVTTSTDLVETFKRADAIVNATKNMLVETGQKPSRDEEYRVLPSVTVYE